MALCSLSTGRTTTPRRRAASITMPPAMTRISLLASAIVLPASIAASTASRAAVPDEANSTTSASGWVATAMRPSAPPAARLRRAATRSSACTSASAAAEAIATRSGRTRSICSAQRAAFSPAASATTCRLVGMRVDDRQRALPDRSGRSEDRDALHRTLVRLRPGGTARTRNRPGRRTASCRCDRGRRRGPGMSADESLTPALRLSSDSNRSPTMPEHDHRRGKQREHRERRGRKDPQAAGDHRRRAEDEPADRALARLLRADRRRERRAAERAAGVVLRRVADDDREHQQQHRFAAPDRPDRRHRAERQADVDDGEQRRRRIAQDRRPGLPGRHGQRRRPG